MYLWDGRTGDAQENNTNRRLSIEKSETSVVGISGQEDSPRFQSMAKNLLVWRSGKASFSGGLDIVALGAKEGDGAAIDILISEETHAD